MTKSKKPNPIEEAIGARAKKPKTPEMPSQVLRDVPEQPLTINEAANLEALNQATEERLQDQYLEEPMTTMPIKTATGKTAEVPLAKFPSQKTLVSKPDPQPVTKTSSPESPPQENENALGRLDACLKKEIPKLRKEGLYPLQEINEIDEYSDAVKSPALGTPEDQDNEAQRQDSASLDNHKEHVEAFNKAAKELGFPLHPEITSVAEAAKHIQETKAIEVPAEDKHLTALRDYIMDTGFVASGVAFHIVALCSQPMTTPTTTTWAFKDRASIPDMVFALLKQPGYIEGIWPSLKVVMADNKGNAVWTAGIATTIAFFDVIRTLPTIKELSNEEKP